ncbi:MAG: DUF814 domain-containing protein, partial [Desulfovibrio sp.]|nr:DUF814 domain-containing protein [Desulfovibrio sp.]
MDAHLFRLFCYSLIPILEGARIEKIQEAGKNLLILSLFSRSRKFRLYFHSGKQKPFCFIHTEKLDVEAHPSAQVMRIRKYFGQKRVAAIVPQYYSRKLWLLAATPENTDKAAWLCLDLAKGPSLFFLSPDEAPKPEIAKWPSMAELPGALENWRDWPVLTPPLRRALKELEAPDQAALLMDLEEGGGDVFLIKSPDGQIIDASALPASRARLGENTEEAASDVMEALGGAGMAIIAGDIAAKKSEDAARPANRRLRRIEKLLAKLDQDEARMKALGSREGDALWLRANLWRFPSDFRADKLEDDGRRVALDSRYTVRENMERLFRQIRKAKRGLSILEERRAAILAEKADLARNAFIPQSASAAKNEIMANPASPGIFPKNIRPFRSSDGYLILRGKDARGNLAIRKMASGYDYWLHVENGPGTHVIIRRNNPADEVPDRTIR